MREWPLCLGPAVGRGHHAAFERGHQWRRGETRGRSRWRR